MEKIEFREIPLKYITNLEEYLRLNYTNLEFL